MGVYLEGAVACTLFRSVKYSFIEYWRADDKNGVFPGFFISNGLLHTQIPRFPGAIYFFLFIKDQLTSNNHDCSVEHRLEVC